ncbi:MAG: GIY-YIG nuclease family protein [Bacteroidales bacterium]|nr:GIY-YIG nuclease family protein [Bacteroidales bacterium]
MKFAVLDIETTGLSPSQEKITEIAIFIYDGEKIVDEYSTLIHPEKKISYRITQLTGINNQMVADAPKFYEVAKKIVEITEDAVLVGHNVRFDYGFIRHEFLRLGFQYERKTMDTVSLSRKLIPGKPSYSLGKLCHTLGIENAARHRAAGDAMATLKLFQLLQSIEPDLHQHNGIRENRERNRSLLDGLPEKAGVYYFYNKSGSLIYVGKSVNIRERVQSHLNNHSDPKELEIKNQLAEVKFKVTGSELVALLLESHEIKKHQPLFNHAQRRTFFRWGLYSFTDEKGYLNLKLMKTLDRVDPIFTYGSLQEGQDHVYRLCEEYNLCQKLTGLYESSGACFYYQIHRCNGACLGEELPEEYNNRVLQSIENYHFNRNNFLIFDEGRTAEEKSVVKVENGRYVGFGFVSGDEVQSPHEAIESYHDNKEVRQIIISYIKRNAGRKVTVVDFDQIKGHTKSDYL